MKFKDLTGFVQQFMKWATFHLTYKKDLQGAGQGKKTYRQKGGEQGHYTIENWLVGARLPSFKG